MKRYYVIFKGRVQGVGFRYTIKELAQKYGFTGSCKNLLNGNVEVEVQGNENNIMPFIADVLEPRRFIVVNDYSFNEIDVVENEGSFRIEH